MAIDSAAKRRSAAGTGLFLLGPGVTPDATPDAFWRLSAAWSYGGIAAGEPEEPPDLGPAPESNPIQGIIGRSFGRKPFEGW